MKSKGFTLIELLAVIAVLAVIALITIPLVYNITKKSRKESYERSIDLYANAIRNGISEYEIDGDVNPGKYSSDNLPFNIDYEGDVKCSTIEIYANGKIYLDGCTVNKKKTEYVYGTKQQIYKPQYYSWDFGEYNWDLVMTVDKSAVPENPSTVPPTGEKRYIGYDGTDGIVSAGYVCFKREENSQEYCLKGTKDGLVFAKNVEIIKDAFSDEVNTEACSYNNSYFHCEAGDLFVHASSDGNVYAYDDDGGCYFYDTGYFECYSFG